MRAAQIALRESETRLRDMLECSSDYMWETDASERVISFVGAGSQKYPSYLGSHGLEVAFPTNEPSDLNLLLEHLTALFPAIPPFLFNLLVTSRPRLLLLPRHRPEGARRALLHAVHC